MLLGLPSLRNLYLGSCSMTGTLPSVFSGLEQLKLLYLGQNQISGTIPASIAGLSSLTYVPGHTAPCALW